MCVPGFPNIRIWIITSVFLPQKLVIILGWGVPGYPMQARNWIIVGILPGNRARIAAKKGEPAPHHHP
jgi:hypothetical protein